jgi:hypothetical protein
MYCTVSCELTRDKDGVSTDGMFAQSCPRPTSSLSAFKLLLTHRSSIFPTQVVYAFFLVPREPHVITIDPLPPSTSPARDVVPNHRRTSHSSAQSESAASAVLTNLSPSGRFYTTGISPLIPATRLRSELEGENRIDAAPHPPEIRPCTLSTLHCFN